MMWAYHNSHDRFYRDPFGAVPCGTKIHLKIETELNSRDPAVQSVFLYKTFEHAGQEISEQIPMLPDDAPSTPREGLFRVELVAPENPGLLWYYFRIERADGVYYYGNNPNQKGGPGRLTDHVPPGFQVTVHAPGLATPDWIREAVVYQVFVDRFYNGFGEKVLHPKKNSLLHAYWENDPVYIRDMATGKVVRWDFFGGNLEGLRQKLSYLKTLGVRAIYLNPIFEAPSNHKYDTADYHTVDSMYGTGELFETLCAEARQMGLHVILDGVFSHTGSDSIYFNREGNYPSLGAYQSPDSPYFPWYRFTDYPHKYESWWGIETMPNVNELESSYQDFIIFAPDSVLRHWQKKGARGWRLDVVDELPGEFVKNFRRVTKEQDPDAVLIGEVWEDASNKVSYGERREYLLGEELDSTTNYPLRRILLNYLLEEASPWATHMSLMSLYENYPRQHFYSALNLTGSHDVPRILTELGKNLPETLAAPESERIATERLRLFSLWQASFPGVPCIYYGDEAGLEGGEDPDNRRAYPWGRENRELLEWFKTVIALRNHYDVLQTGSWQILYAGGDIYGFLRVIEGGSDLFDQVKKDNAAVLLFNRSWENSADLSLDLSRWFEESAVDVLNDYQAVALSDGCLELTLNPLEGRMLLKDRWGSNRQEVRESGVLLHPTSLPSAYGIGGLGREARAFIDFLQASGQGLWQILPLNPPGLGFSPYQCFSAFAGNPLLIDPEALVRDQLLTRQDLENPPLFPDDRVDFSRVETYKAGLWRRAFARFTALGGINKKDFHNFCRENWHWLEDYALFMALKDHFQGLPWNQWEKAAAFRKPPAMQRYRQKLQEEVTFHHFLQYIFFQQWFALKEYAREKGIRIVGDLPIFVAHDSSDVWSRRDLFALDKKGNPSRVAGVPPDYFSEDGQLWGNPLYRWGEMEANGYRWWKDRFALLNRLVDLMRIDHFRGFEAFWEVAAGEESAVNGQWVKGPGEPFFRQVMAELGPLDVIAEDLGHITPEVEDLKVRLGFPGMMVMQFMLEGSPGEKLSLPLYQKNTVLYTGTHDNDTMLGWYQQIAEAAGRAGPSGTAEEEINWYYIELAMGSDAQRVIIPMQDLLGLGSEARMNTPGTARGNWGWRLLPAQMDRLPQERLLGLTRQYCRHHFSQTM